MEFINYLGPRILALITLVCFFYGIHFYFVFTTPVCVHGKSQKKYCYFCELNIDSDLDNKW